MRNHVRFRSVEFSPADIEPGQVSAERYGYVLATWVAARLSERGVLVDAPVPEDWGWLLDASHAGQTVQLGCGNLDGSVTEWLIWIEGVQPGLFARLLGRGIPAAPNAERTLVEMVDWALRSRGGVDGIEWFRLGPRGEELDHAPTPA